MCGIVGILSDKLSNQDYKVMQHLIILDTVRGYDGTGIAIIEKNNQYTIKKSAATGPEFLKDTHFPRGIPDCKIMIGHNRAATTGAVTADNAHPFGFENLVGVHNGTLSHWGAYKLKNYKNYDVDSQCFYADLNESNIAELWKTIEGAFALCWFDKRDNKLHFIRNKERTLFYAFSEDDKTLFWASEEWMINVATSRSGVKIKKAQPFVENEHYIFDIEENKTISFTRETLPEYQKKVYPVVSTGYYGNNYGFQNSRKDDTDWSYYNNNYSTNEYDPDNKILLLEVEKVNDLHTRCMASTEYGDLVVVNINSSDINDFNNKLKGRGKINNFYSGLYTPKRLYSYQVAVRGAKFFTNWRELKWENLGKDETINYGKEYGWNISKKRSQDGGNSAPWYNKSLISKSLWKEIVEENCCGYCGKIPEWENRYKLGWIDRRTFLCEECVNDPLVIDQIGKVA